VSRLVLGQAPSHLEEPETRRENLSPPSAIRREFKRGFAPLYKNKFPLSLSEERGIQGVRLPYSIKNANA